MRFKLVLSEKKQFDGIFHMYDFVKIAF